MDVDNEIGELASERKETKPNKVNHEVVTELRHLRREGRATERREQEVLGIPMELRRQRRLPTRCVHEEDRCPELGRASRAGRRRRRGGERADHEGHAAVAPGQEC
ncbi:hypothetical protein EJB05_07357, partial [Eragrostis curvula]